MGVGYDITGVSCAQYVSRRSHWWTIKGGSKGSHYLRSLAGISDGLGYYYFPHPSKFMGSGLQLAETSLSNIFPRIDYSDNKG